MLGRRGRLEQLIGRLEPGYRLEVLHGREDEVELPCVVAVESLLRPDPYRLDRLVVVVDGGLPGRDARHEEARVEPLRRRLGGDPVREVQHPVHGEKHPRALARLEEAHPLGIHLGPEPGEARLGRDVLRAVERRHPWRRQGRRAGCRLPRSTLGAPRRRRRALPTPSREARSPARPSSPRKPSAPAQTGHPRRPFLPERR